LEFMCVFQIPLKVKSSWRTFQKYVTSFKSFQRLVKVRVRTHYEMKVIQEFEWGNRLSLSSTCDRDR